MHSSSPMSERAPLAATLPPAAFKNDGMMLSAAQQEIRSKFEVRALGQHSRQRCCWGPTWGWE